MDGSSAFPRLVTLTAGLTPTAQACADDLLAARKALAASLLSHGAVDPLTAAPGLPPLPAAAPTPAEVAELTGILGQDGTAQDGMARRGHGAAGVPAQRARPGTGQPRPDALAGDRHAIADDRPVHRRHRCAAMVRHLPGSGTADRCRPIPGQHPVPAAAADGARRAHPCDAVRRRLQPVDRRAALLAASAPACGYRLHRPSAAGRLPFSLPPVEISGELRIDVGITATLTVTPASPPGGPGGSGGTPGADGGAVVADPPGEVTFVFTGDGRAGQRRRERVGHDLRQHSGAAVAAASAPVYDAANRSAPHPVRAARWLIHRGQRAVRDVRSGRTRADPRRRMGAAGGGNGGLAAAREWRRTRAHWCSGWARGSPRRGKGSPVVRPASEVRPWAAPPDSSR